MGIRDELLGSAIKDMYTMLLLNPQAMNHLSLIEGVSRFNKETEIQDIISMTPPVQQKPK